VHNDVVLRESHLWQRLALCHTDLCVHQVDPGGQTDSVMGNNFHRETCRLSLHRDIIKWNVSHWKLIETAL